MSFELVAQFQWETAISQEDTRQNYGETRLRIFGRIGQRLHVAVVTRRGDAVHVISFRKANDREVRWYEQNKA